MAVYIANLSVDTGVDFQHGFSLGDNDTGTFLNLTNYTATSQMRKWAGSTTAVSFASSLGSTQTADLKPGRYLYDVNLEDSGGYKYKVVEGMVLVRAGVTR